MVKHGSVKVLVGPGIRARDVPHQRWRREQRVEETWSGKLWPEIPHFSSEMGSLFPNTAEGGGGTISDGSSGLPLLLAILLTGAWTQLLLLLLVITDRSQPDPAQLCKKRDWDVMATAPFPGKSSAVPWGFTHTSALSLADCCPWWFQQDFSSLIQFLVSYSISGLLFHFWVTQGSECEGGGNLEPPRDFGKCT